MREQEKRQIERLGAAQEQIQRALDKLRARLYDVDTEVANLETDMGNA